MKKNIKISFVLNIIIFILTLIASIIMFTGFKFMNGYDIVLESSKVGMFKFFTVDSNMFMGLIALIFAYYEYKLLKNEINEIPKSLYLIKFISTAAVSLTFFVVFVYLGPTSKGGIASMLMNSNLFYHLIIPVLSIITFLFFERTNKLSFKNSFYGLIPAVVYSFFYIINILIHMNNGYVSVQYDWYWFVQNGVWTSFIVGPLILLVDYFLCFILWKFNKVK